MASWLVVLTLIVAISSGVVGGVFFGFSTFVMKALDRLAPRESIRAMQAINVAAPNAWFMAFLVGTALLCVPVGIAAIARWGEPGAGYQLIGSLVYLLGFAITPAYHIPRNDALDRVDSNAVDAPRMWAGYAVGWTRWNHARTLTGIAAAVLFTVAVRLG